MSSSVLSLAGWTFLPNLVTGWVQSIYYGITVRAGDPKPHPGTPRYLAHRRRIHILVISAYLLYTIYEADYELQRSGDFYRDLSIPYSATDREIKSRFRRLAAVHHPDKVGSNSNGASSEGYFMHLKMAQDTLLNPAKRFAYERFGPQMVEWQRCSSIRDYVLHGMQSVVPYYVVAAVAMYILGLLGYLEWGKYWRWLSLVVLCVFEVHTISRPSHPFFADKIINPLLTTFTHHPPYLPFQLIQLSRKISITIYIAFSQIGPLLVPAAGPSAPVSASPEIHLREQLERLDQISQAADLEATRLMGLEMSPFIGDQESLGGLKGKVKEWLVQNTIRSDPEVRDALGNLLKRRRVDAPAGARGTK